MTNQSHLRTILADIEEHRSSYLMHMGGNDLGSRGNAIDNAVIGLTAFLTQIRVQFNIPSITVMRFMPAMGQETLTLKLIMSVLY